MLRVEFKALLLILFTSFAIGAEFNHSANQNLDYAVWDTNQIWLGNATFRQIDIGNKLKGPNDDTFRVFTVQTNDVRLALLFTDTSHTEPIKWRNEIVDIGVYSYYGGQIGDVDRDGDNEIIYGRYVSPYYLFRAHWQWGGWIVDTIKSIPGANLAMDIGDADNDGNADDIIYTAGISSNSRLYRAHWSGTSWDTATIWTGDGRNIYGLAIGNFDDSNGDSNEIVAATWGTVNDGGRIMRIRWTGSNWDTLTLWKAADNVAFSRVAIGNFDASNSGNEIAAANGFSTESENRGAVFEIYGSGSTWAHRPIYIPTPPETTNARGIAVGDVTDNNPGDEVVFSNSAGRGYKLRAVYGSDTTWSNEEITNIGAQSYCVAIGNVNKYRNLNQEITYTGDGLGVFEAEQKIINNDVGVTKIEAPSGMINLGSTITPACSVYNYGNTPATYSVRMKIGTLYDTVAIVSNHLPGTAVYVNNFPSWTALQPDSQAVSCSTQLTGDENTPNDKMTGRVFVQNLDAQAIQIIQPSGTINLNDTMTPQAIIKNNGNTAQTFSGCFTITDGYSDSKIVPLGPNVQTTVNFALWTANTPGSFQTKCSTELIGDMNPANDTLSGSVFVQDLDAQSLTIIQPTGSVNLGDTVTPQVMVRNNGNTSVSFPVLFTIGDGYSNTQTVNSLAPGNTTTINFALWTANIQGSFPTRCSTGLAGDRNSANDTLAGSVLVNFIDVQTVTIIQPTGILNLGDTITPRATVRNNGNTTQTFQVKFNINDGYSDSTVLTLLPDSQTTNNFARWTTSLPGSFQVKCYTQLAGDMNPANDTLYDSVFVQGFDAQPITIIQPTGIVNRGDTMTPKALIRNNGNTFVTFPVRFTIEDGYTDSQNVSLSAGSDTTVIFSLWTASTQGSFQTRCSTDLIGDMNPPNDTIAGSVFVRVFDVGTTAILAPIDTVNLGTIIAPQAKVKNYGNTNVTFDVSFTINDPNWTSIKTVTNLNPAEERTVDFDEWTAGPLGTLATKCTTKLNGDFNNDNDKLVGSVVVRYSWNSPAGWSRMADIPIAASNKKPKSGSCMAGLDAAGKIYFLKASNTQDFALFTPDASTGIWTPLDTLPKGDKTLGDGKKPKKGASMAAYPPTKDIYVLRGNSTPGFWKFHTDSAPSETVGWKKLANIPTSAKNPKDASGMVVITKEGNDYIFTMKGSKTDEFYLYDIAHNTWASTPTKPNAGYSGKVGYKKGSCMAYDNTRYVYILKGTYGDMFRYDATNDSFVQLKQFNYKTFVNRLGKKKKVGEGSGMVYDNDNLYILKGGNTLEFWQYQITRDTWLQMNPGETWDIPVGGRRKVKGGGGLIKFGDYFYAAKGANTLEFYRHLLPTSIITLSPNQSPSEGVTANNIATGNFRLTIAPNPTKNVTKVRYSLSKAGPVSIKLYNVTGSLVKSYSNSASDKDGVILIDAKTLASGIYILRFNSNEIAMVRKLVLEK
jgi:hypothetical protein